MSPGPDSSRINSDAYHHRVTRHGISRTRDGDFRVRLSEHERASAPCPVSCGGDRRRRPEPRPPLPAGLRRRRGRRGVPPARARRARRRQARALPELERTAASDRLDEVELGAWLGALESLRLALGTRLDVTEETYAALDPDDPQAPELAVYGWLSWLQEEASRVQALTARRWRTSPRSSPTLSSSSPPGTRRRTSVRCSTELHGELPEPTCSSSTTARPTARPRSRTRHGADVALLRREPRPARRDRRRLRRAQERGYAYCGRVDADGQHPAAELRRLLELVAPGDVRRRGRLALRLRGRLPGLPLHAVAGAAARHRRCSAARCASAWAPFGDATSGMYAANATALPLLAEPYTSGAPRSRA